MASIMSPIISANTVIAITTLILPLYLLLVRTLRYRFSNQTPQKYNMQTRADYAKMTVNQAFEIQQGVAQREFPFTFLKGLQFALFKTYGVPTISKTLVSTKQLSEKEFASRRYADTVVLISEFTENRPESERAVQAISRMNYLHSNYQKAGLISNDDMLYTLVLFATEPAEWIEKFEWRGLTPVELCAQGTFWKANGDAMKISYEKLPSFKKGWTDGLHWYEEANVWAKAYEHANMIPHVANKKTADETTEILFWDVPRVFRPLGSMAVAALLDDHVRKAMMYAAPPSWLRPVFDAVFSFRAFLIRNLFLPRPAFMRVFYTQEKPNEHGRYYRKEFLSEPWYIPNTFWYRNDLNGWIKWAMGTPMPCEEFKAGGYLLPEVGPASMEGKGGDFMKRDMKRLMGGRRGGCPFA